MCRSPLILLFVAISWFPAKSGAQASEFDLLGNLVEIFPDSPTDADPLLFLITVRDGAADADISVQVIGGVVRVVLDPTDTFYSGPEFQYTIDIPAQATGDYVVEYHSGSLLVPIGPDTLVGTSQLRVLGVFSPAQPVPATSSASVIILLLLVVTVAGIVMRKRVSRSKLS